MSDLERELEAIGARVLEVLSHLPAGDSITAWELKFKVKAALSPLYLALGALQAKGRIRIQPDGLNYRVQPAAVSIKPIAGVPLQISSPPAAQDPAGATK